MPGWGFSPTSWWGHRPARDPPIPPLARCLGCRMACHPFPEAALCNARIALQQGRIRQFHRPQLCTRTAHQETSQWWRRGHWENLGPLQLQTHACSYMSQFNDRAAYSIVTMHYNGVTTLLDFSLKSGVTSEDGVHLQSCPFPSIAIASSVP